MIWTSFAVITLAVSTIIHVFTDINATKRIYKLLEEHGKEIFKLRSKIVGLEMEL